MNVTHWWDIENQNFGGDPMTLPFLRFLRKQMCVTLVLPLGIEGSQEGPKGPLLWIPLLFSAISALTYTKFMLNTLNILMFKIPGAHWRRFKDNWLLGPQEGPKRPLIVDPPFIFSNFCTD